MLSIIIIAFLIGILIGGIGLGGILLAPLLIIYTEYDIETILPSATLSYLFTGLAGFKTYYQKCELNTLRNQVFLLAFFGAIIGAISQLLLDEEILIYVIIILLLVSGINMLLNPTIEKLKTSKNKSLEFIVFISSSVSTLSGTGGPVIFLPLSQLVRIDFRTLFGVAQVIQIPIALAGSLVFFLSNSLSLTLALSLGIFQFFGFFLGVILFKNISEKQLKKAIALGLIITAFVMMT